MQKRKCECEHIAHFDETKTTPNTNPGHKYGVMFFNTQEIITNYGKFIVCDDCANDCRKGYLKNEKYT